MTVAGPVSACRTLAEVRKRYGPLSAREEQILSLCLDRGLPVQKVCLALGVARWDVRRLLRRYDAARPLRAYNSAAEVERRHGPLRASERRMLYLYLDCGFTLRQVGEMCGCSVMTVLDYLCDWGVRARPRGRPAQKLPSAEFELTRRLYEDAGLTVAEVALALGITPSAVSERLHNAGAAVRSRAARVKQQRSELDSARVGALIASVRASREPAPDAEPLLGAA